MQNYLYISIAILAVVLFLSTIANSISLIITQADKPTRLWLYSTLMLGVGTLFQFIGSTNLLYYVGYLGQCLQTTGYCFFYMACCYAMNIRSKYLVSIGIPGIFFLGFFIVDEYYHLFQTYAVTSFYILISSIGLYTIGNKLLSFTGGGIYFFTVYLFGIIFGFCRIVSQSYFGLDDIQYFHVVTAVYLLSFCVSISLGTLGVIKYAFYKSRKLVTEE